MNDLDLMAKFRANAAPADPAVLKRARAGMFQPAPRRKPVRWVWRLVPAAGLAAAVAVGAGLVAARPAEQAAAPTVPAETETRNETDTGTGTDAGQVLRLAAAEARREPVLKARPNQFVYVKSRAAWAGAEFNRDGVTAKYLPPVENERRIWLSVNGSRDGLLRQLPVKPGTGDRNLANMPLTGGEGVAAYRADLPTSEKAMRAYLYEGTGKTKPGGNSPDTVAFTKVGDTLREQYVTPASVAAMFDAAATIPGTSVVKQADLVGRRGTAVSRTESGTRHDLIFDSTTYKFLGERDVVVGGGSDPFPVGAVVGWTAQLEVAIVDQAGQLP